MHDFIKSHLGYVSAVVTIAAFVIDKAFSSLYSAIAALSVYSLGVTVLMISIYRLFSKSMSARSKHGFCRMATTCIFRTNDGVHAEFEFRRFIQCKTAFMSCIRHDFKWNGSGEPEIRSDGNVLKPTMNADSGEFDHVIVPIGKNLYYNECAVVSDTFESSYSNINPMFCLKIDEPVGSIDFKIMLGHKSEAPEAVLYKKKFGSKVDMPYVRIDSACFNKTFKMYEISFTPEVGYIYKLEWQK